MLSLNIKDAVDAMRFIVGDFRHVAAVVTTQVPQWLEVDTQRLDCQPIAA